MPTIRIPNGFVPRGYQRKLWDYLERGGRTAVAVWHRRAGKDEIALHRACVAAHERVGNYWHMLPEAAQAKKAIWEAINPKTGKKRIDEAFPEELRDGINNTEMFIRLKCGSTWQVVGSDNYNSLIGSPPVGITYSEWAVANPLAHAHLRPIIAENKGWALFIYTSRGKNHGWKTYQNAINDLDAFAERLTAEDTGVFTPEDLARELQAYKDDYGEHEGEALFRQEYYCDFNASTLGAILARYIDDAERQGRVTDDLTFDPDGPGVEISSDIGFRDTATWWFWQPRPDGFAIVDHDKDSGLEASEWIDRLKEKDYPIRKIWLPRDAKAKTMATRHSVAEQFVKAFGVDKVEIVPAVKVRDRINAARTVVKNCVFHKTRCAKGLDGLTSWTFVYNDETKTFSQDPKHDWASHDGDGFSYGAVVMRERKVVKPKGEEKPEGFAGITMNDCWDTQLKRSTRI